MLSGPLVSHCISPLVQGSGSLQTSGHVSLTPPSGLSEDTRWPSGACATEFSVPPLSNRKRQSSRRVKEKTLNNASFASRLPALR